MDAAAEQLAAMDPFPDMSEEEILALLQRYESSGMGLGPVPENLEVRACAPRARAAPARRAQSLGERRAAARPSPRRARKTIGGSVAGPAGYRCRAPPKPSGRLCRSRRLPR